jgi:hypothetical protein
MKRLAVGRGRCCGALDVAAVWHDPPVDGRPNQCPRRCARGRVAGQVLTAARCVTAVVDTDMLAQFGPRPESTPAGGRFHDELKCANLAALWANFKAAGARFVVVAAVIDSLTLRERYTESLAGCEVRLIRLTADDDIVRSRLRQRDTGPKLEQHLRALNEHRRIPTQSASRTSRLPMTAPLSKSLPRSLCGRVGQTPSGERRSRRADGAASPWRWPATCDAACAPRLLLRDRDRACGPPGARRALPGRAGARPALALRAQPSEPPAGRAHRRSRSRPARAAAAPPGRRAVPSPDLRMLRWIAIAGLWRRQAAAHVRLPRGNQP